MTFRNRAEAGQLLGTALLRHAGKTSLILGLSPGGIAVAYQVARALRAPLDAGRAELPDLRERTAIVVDDGSASEMVLRATLDAVRQRRPKFVVLASPVLREELARSLDPKVDELVTLREPRGHYALGAWYEELEPVSEEEILRLLLLAGRTSGALLDHGP
jgi:putative phosphoribosyl transferase